MKTEEAWVPASRVTELEAKIEELTKKVEEQTKEKGTPKVEVEKQKEQTEKQQRLNSSFAQDWLKSIDGSSGESFKRAKAKRIGLGRSGADKREIDEAFRREDFLYKCWLDDLSALNSYISGEPRPYRPEPKPEPRHEPKVPSYFEYGEGDFGIQAEKEFLRRSPPALADY